MRGGDGRLRILFITATRIGDGVLSTGLYAHLARSPDARLTVACGAPAAPVFANAPRLERIIVMKKRGLHGHWLSLWAACVGRAWDIVVDLRGSGFAWTVMARDRRVKRKARVPMHRVEEIAAVLGLDPPPAPVAWTGEREEARAAALIPAGGPVLCVAPTANWRAKEWRIEHFRALVGRLVARDGLIPDARVAVVGAAEERPRALPLIDAIAPDRLIDLYGQPIPETVACFKRADLFVGNDSGLMHLAAAAGAPTLGLFGPTREVHYAPWGDRAAFVRTRETWEELVFAPGFDHRTSDTLMDGLTVEAAEAAARALWLRCHGTRRDNETPARLAQGR